MKEPRSSDSTSLPLSIEAPFFSSRLSHLRPRRGTSGGHSQAASSPRPFCRTIESRSFGRHRRRPTDASPSACVKSSLLRRITNARSRCISRLPLLDRTLVLQCQPFRFDRLRKSSTRSSTRPVTEQIEVHSGTRFDLTAMSYQKAGRNESSVCG